MKYLKQFFNAKAAAPKPSIDTKSVADRPCFIEQTEQPLPVLQRFVPIRGLDSRTAKLLPHKMLHYAAGDTLFLMHQATPSVWYLFEGTLTILPDGAAPFEMRADSLRAHLPINSGKKFGASGVAQSYVKILEVSADLIAHWTSQSKQQEQCVVIIVFFDVVDYRHISEENIKPEVMKTYNYICLVLDSDWLIEKNISNKYKHFMIYFDEYGLYEIIAKKYKY